MKKEKRVNLQAFGLIYFMLFFISVIFNEQEAYLRFPKLDETFLKTMSLDAGLALVTGFAIVLVTWLLMKYTPSFQQLLKNFRTLLGPLTLTEIFFIAAFSSLAEEFFFRGLVQAKIGIVAASLLFGALHTGPGKKYIPWTIFALAMGFLLGWIYEWRGNLMIPVIIHFVVNFVNLFLLCGKRSVNDPV